MKKCNSCNIEKEFIEFNIRKASKDGLSPICKSCKKIADKKYRINNPEKRLAHSIKWALNNPDKTKEIKTKWFKNNKEKVYVSVKKWYDKNKISGKIDLNKARRIRKKYRLKNDTLYKLENIVRTAVKNSLNGYTKKSRTYEILGCSYEEFKSYIESKFEIWMNWSNHGLYTGNYSETWQLDHIIPISSAKTEEDMIKLNHYTNLQPLCSKINQIDKKNKLDW